MLPIKSVERIRSGELLDRLKQMHQLAMVDSETDYILRPCPSQRPVRVVPVLEAKVDNGVRELLLKETRALMTQRFSLRTGDSRRSFRVRERPTTTAREYGSYQPPVTRSRESSTDRTVSEGQLGASLSVTAAARGRSLFRGPPSHGTTHRDVDYTHSFEDTGATFMHRIDTIVRESLNSTETDAGVYEAAFDITWELQQSIRDELDGSPNLGPILTVTGNPSHAWATSCHEYVQATWNEAARGEQFLKDLELFLGKRFTSSGQYGNVPFHISHISFTFFSTFSSFCSSSFFT